MKKLRRLLSEHRFDFVVGLCDGILTALTLTAGKMIASPSPVGIGLALRVATAGASSGAFIYFVAHYAQLRGELVEAERQLNLTSHGRLASSRLGHAVLFQSAAGAIIASAAGFGGALLPLLVGTVAPGVPWLAIVVAMAVLAVFGAILAVTVHGRPLRWALGLVLAGGILTYVGMRLRLI
jgi:VIT1/CCC1 family predicted Fe2+/Mn2+ transporter